MRQPMTHDLSEDMMTENFRKNILRDRNGGSVYDVLKHRMVNLPKTRKPPDRAAACRAFGVALRTLRERKGLAQEDFAYLCGVERAHMSLMENGRCNATLETMMKLLPTLGVSFTEFASEFDRCLLPKRRSGAA